MRRRWIAAAGLLVAACGSTPMKPTPVANAPQITCPADVSLPGITGSSQPVTFATPTITGGAAPVNVSCSQSSGASFPLGTTSVSCSATDAQSRQAACAFRVTVSGLTLAIKRFESVGDSLTEGENALPVPTFVDPPNAYPTKLQTLFDLTYPGQGIVVINRGEGGRRVEETYAKLSGFLASDRPDAVLLMSGYNNLTTPCRVSLGGTRECNDAVADMALGVRDCIRRVKESPVGVKYVFVSTLVPPGPLAPNTKDHRIDRIAIVEANKRIVQMVSAEGVTLVDSYAAFLGHESEYVSIDGLHLRPAGYQAIADAFFSVIKATVPQTSLVATTGAR